MARYKTSFAPPLSVIPISTTNTYTHIHTEPRARAAHSAFSITMQTEDTILLFQIGVSLWPHSAIQFFWEMKWQFPYINLSRIDTRENTCSQQEWALVPTAEKSHHEKSNCEKQLFNEKPGCDHHEELKCLQSIQHFSWAVHNAVWHPAVGSTPIRLQGNRCITVYAPWALEERAPRQGLLMAGSCSTPHIRKWGEKQFQLKLTANNVT